MRSFSFAVFDFCVAVACICIATLAAIGTSRLVWHVIISFSDNKALCP